MKPYIIILALIFASCNLNNNSLEREVRKSMQQTFNSEQMDIKVHDFKLVKISDGYYEGVLWTNESGDIYIYDVEVVVHKNGAFEWEILGDGNVEDDYEGSNSKESYSYSNDNKNSSAAPTLKEHLTQNYFSVNGNGSVTFSFNSYSEDGSIHIKGNGKALVGKCSVSGNTIYINGLVAVSGAFDASNNNGSSGVFYLDNNGSLTGSLMDSRGNSVETTFKIR